MNFILCAQVSFSNYDFMCILMLPSLRMEYDCNFSLHGFQKVKKVSKLCSMKVKTLKENKKIYLSFVKSFIPLKSR